MTNILDEHVLQPLLVTQSAITLAAETVAMILKIDGKERIPFPALQRARTHTHTHSLSLSSTVVSSDVVTVR